jgi:hypothetical protein
MAANDPDLMIKQPTRYLIILASTPIKEENE